MKIALLILLAFAAMQLNAQTLAHYQRIIKDQTVRFESYEPVFKLVGDFIERYRPLP